MKKVLIVILLLLIVSLVGCKCIFNIMQNQKVLKGSGTIELTAADVGFKISGELIDYYVKEGDIVTSGTHIARLNRGALSRRIETVKAAIVDCEDRLAELKGDDSKQQDRNTLISMIEQTKEYLGVLEEEFRDTDLFAPFDCIVLKKYLKFQDEVSAGTPVLKLENLNKPVVKIYVNKDKIGHVKPGQKAKVKTAALPNKVFEGSVTFISSKAVATPKNIQTKEERAKEEQGKQFFEVTVSVNNHDRLLKPRMPVDVSINPK